MYFAKILLFSGTQEPSIGINMLISIMGAAIGAFAGWVTINKVVSTLKEKVAGIEKRLDKLEPYANDITELKVKDRLNDSNITALKMEIKELSSGIINLGSEVVTHVSLSEERINNLNGKIGDLNSEFREDIKRINALVESLKESNKKNHG